MPRKETIKQDGALKQAATPPAEKPTHGSKGGPALTHGEWQAIQELVRKHSVHIGAPGEIHTWQRIERAITDWLEPGLFTSGAAKD